MNLVFLNKNSTLGIKGAYIDLFNKFIQGKSLNQGCSLTSNGPFEPNLYIGFLDIHYLTFVFRIRLYTLLIKSAASFDQPSVISFFLI